MIKGEYPCFNGLTQAGAPVGDVSVAEGLYAVSVSRGGGGAALFIGLLSG